MKHLGSIWSGVKKNFVLGAKQADFSNCDEDIKVIIKEFNQTNAERTGFPLKFESPSFVKPIRLQPWYERKTKQEMQTAKRSQFRKHRDQLRILPYGFIVDMEAEM